MKLVIFFLLVVLFQDLPYKPSDEFDVQIDYKFRQRPAASPTTVNLGETQEDYNRRTSSNLLPYLILNVNLLKLNNEVRVRITNNLNTKTSTRKISQGDNFSIDMGFTADVKDRVTPHEYVMTFLASDKKETARIVIHIEQDGTFVVNGEKRGRF